MVKIFLVIIEILRVFDPLLIFFNPLLASIGSLILDGVDGILFFRAGYKWQTYNLVDKIMDYWWYIFILIYSINLPIFTIILVLFVYRTIGQAIGLVTMKEKYYIFFPNILEWFFDFFIVIQLFGFAHLFSSGNFNIIILGLSSCIAFYIEWRTHIKRDSIIAKNILKTTLDWSKNEVK